MMHLEYESLYRATRRFLLLGMLVISFGSFVKANGPVAGRVTDEDGFELPGVTVVFKGEARGTVTGTDGRYQLTKPQGGGILVFSFIGMETLEIEVSNEEVVDAVLVAAITRLSEVVAVGYGSQRKSDITGSDLVTVVFKGEARGTVTGTDGRYQLTKPQGGGILVFSFIGMETLEIEVSNEEVVDAVLVAAITRLSEVVAVGYGSQRKSDITGSVVSVGREQFN